MSQQMHYRPDIDGLRAVAVISVVVFHAFPKLLRGGFLGVDVFFVISGFLIAGIVLREHVAGTFSIANFYARRIKRIFPALLLVLAASLGVGLLMLFDVELLQMAQHALYGTAGLANISLYQDTGYFSLESEYNPMLHLWSLGVEEQFYLILPALVLLLGKRPRWLVSSFAGIFIITLALNIDPFGLAQTTSKFYLPQYRAWELMAGVLLAYISVKFRNNNQIIQDQKKAEICSYIGLALLVFAFIYFKHKSPQWLASGAAVSGAVLLIAGGTRTLINRSFLSTPVMVTIGLISYPLYLWHWPLLVFGRLANPEISKVFILGLIATALLLAYLTWKYVETPIRKGQWKLRPVPWLTVGMTCVAACAIFLVQQKGRVGYATHTNHLAFTSVEGPVHNKSCQARYWTTSSNPDVYILCSDTKKTTQPSVMIIGDSHAHHLFEGMKKYYSKKGEQVVAFTTSGCSLFPDKPASRQCAHAYKQIFQQLSEMPSIHTVVLSEYVAYMVDKNHKHWSRLVRERITSLTESGRKVILMLDIPSFKKHPRQYCYPRLPFLSNLGLEDRCTIPRDEYDKKVTAYRKRVAAGVEGLDNVVVFDAANILCDNKKCKALIDGQLIYRDTNHLNYYGSLYLSRFYDWENDGPAFPQDADPINSPLEKKGK